MTIRIGNGAGFLGDNLDAPRRLVESAELDYLTLEYLAELTLSILARQREKNPQLGYARDFIDVLGSLISALRKQRQLRIVTNAGGVNSRACAVAAAGRLVDAGMGDTTIGIVAGDELLPQLDKLRAAGCPFTNLDTGMPLDSLNADIVSANAYLGAREMVAVLSRGARIVIAGRVADASLTVAPAIHEFGWRWDDLHRLAGASVAGHLIECGTQVCGGFYPHWEGIGLEQVGYPIAELADDGSCRITKPADSKGCVNRETVCEQLVYEIGDPAHYLTPDVDVDFTTVEVDDLGHHCVAVSGARGRKPPDTLKVSLTYRAGFMAYGQMLVYGENCLAKAKACAELIFTRLRQAGYIYEATNVEMLGAGDGVPGLASAAAAHPPEVMLRITVRDSCEAAVERFTREFSPLATSGPGGLAGYTAAKGNVRPVYAYWPTLVPRHLVETTYEVRPAAAWVAQESLGHV